MDFFNRWIVQFFFDHEDCCVSYISKDPECKSLDVPNWIIVPANVIPIEILHYVLRWLDQDQDNYINYGYNSEETKFIQAWQVSLKK